VCVCVCVCVCVFVAVRTVPSVNRLRRLEVQALEWIRPIAAHRPVQADSLTEVA